MTTDDAPKEVWTRDKASKPRKKPKTQKGRKKNRKLKNRGLKYAEREKLYKANFEVFMALVAGTIKQNKAEELFEIPRATIAKDLVTYRKAGKEFDAPVGRPLDQDAIDETLQHAAPLPDDWAKGSEKVRDVLLGMLVKAVEEVLAGGGDHKDVAAYANAFTNIYGKHQGAVKNLFIINQNNVNQVDGYTKGKTLDRWVRDNLCPHERDALLTMLEDSAPCDCIDSYGERNMERGDVIDV